MRSKARTAARITTLLGVVAYGMLGLPPASLAAPKPPPQPLQDSVSASGFSTFCSGPLAITAQSGPTGQNPTGQVTCGNLFSGPVTCLNVRSGDDRFITGSALLIAQTTVGELALIVATSPRFGDAIGVALTSQTGVTGCSQQQPSYLDLGFSGTIVIVNAPPLPTSKDQCQNGGWRNFGDTFKNQGQCVAFVQRGPKP